jgi:hypothetical protein
MNQWVKCTCSQGNYHGASEAYVNLATIQQMYRYGASTVLVFSKCDLDTMIWVRETPEQLLGQLAGAPMLPLKNIVTAPAAPN